MANTATKQVSSPFKLDAFVQLNGSNIMKFIEACYRPDTYWPSSMAPEHLLFRINGKDRQEIARRLYEQYGFSALNEFLVKEGLSIQERCTWGSLHPSYLGGEFLPSLLPSEVEIARISMKSTTNDQISVRASREKELIRYRIVGEYEDDGIQYLLPFDTSEQPLTLSEVMRLIDGARLVGESCSKGIFTSAWTMMAELGYDEANTIGFLSLSSPFYQDLNEYYELWGSLWYAREMHLHNDE